MKRNKQISLMFLMLTVMAMLMAFQASAQGRLDGNRKSSLTLTYRYGDTDLEGAEFFMYKVADTDEYGNYRISKAMRAYPVHLDFSRKYTDEEWGNWAVTLKNLVSADETIKPDVSAKTDKNGVVTLTAPEAGIYLVIGNPHHQGDRIYKTKASLFALPAMNPDDNTWVYEAKAEPKADGIPEKAPESLKVKKIWNDVGYSYRRPEEITVELRRNGALYDTVVLKKENGWSYEWRKKLDAASDWTVVEKSVPSGYTVSMKTDGITITIMNTTGGRKTPNEQTPSHHEKIVDQDPPAGIPEIIKENPVSLTSLPQTGTTWWLVFIFAGASVFFLLTGYIRKHGCEKHEKY